MSFIMGNLQTVKLGLHIAQAVFIFVTWCITIAYFTRATFIGANVGWYFGLCFLSVPIIIYQTLTSRFARSKKWASPYAFAILDVISAILWLSAFAAVAAWNSAGLCLGACQLSKTMVGLGFFIFLFFSLTSAIAIYGVLYYRREGTLPGARIPNNASMIDPDREAFSTAPNDEYAPVQLNDKDDHHNTTSELGASGSYNSRYDNPNSFGTGAGAGAYASPHVEDDDNRYGGSTSYGGANSTVGSSYGGVGASDIGYGGASAPAGRVYSPPPAVATSYGGAPGRAQFPSANYS